VAALEMGQIKKEYWKNVYKKCASDKRKKGRVFKEISHQLIEILSASTESFESQDRESSSLMFKDIFGRTISSK